MSRRVLVMAAAVLAGGCANIDVKNADAAPGGTVTTVDHTKNAVLGWIPSLTPRNDPGFDAWTRVRVIAPGGATECRLGGVFTRRGPEWKARPDADRVAMLTVHEGSRSAEFICKTPRGEVRRVIDASPYARPVNPAAPSYMKPFTFYRMPPLVHMDRDDPNAEARWKAIGAELCPVISENAFGFTCKPGMLEKFKAEDLDG